MKTINLRIGDYDFFNAYYNLSPQSLTTLAILRKEGLLSKTGALSIKTGKYTGRSPEDRYIVDGKKTHEIVDWGKTNKAISEENYAKLYQKICKNLAIKKEIFVFDGYAGADKKYRYPVRVITNTAARSLFIGNMLRKATEEELATFSPEIIIYADTSVEATKDEGTQSEAFVVLNMEKKTILIGNTSYCGEIKKSIFSMLNYLLPLKNVLPMHCSANEGSEGDSALFFGLSGTGKTTLSTDPSRHLIGDDEHGWSENGIFNFEGGSYAKCINLNPEFEPLIFNAIKSGAVVENVVMDPVTKEFNFADASLTENTRAGFPLDFIPGIIPSGMGAHPKNIIFLTADAFGVLPPVSILNINQAIYHFMSGYTSKLAGTERGIVEPKAAFSSFFGEPFMPHKPMIYGNLLKNYLQKYGAKIFLINTGWANGPYGIGKRISIKDTRAIVTASLNGDLNTVSLRHDAILNLDVPENCPGVDASILNPRNTWQNKNAYDEQAKNLAKMFVENFKKFKEIPEEIMAAGPQITG